MNKKELLNKFVEELNAKKEENKPKVTKKDAEFYIDTLLDTIMDCVVVDGKLQLIGFGTWEKKPVKAKSGVIAFGDKKGQEWSKDETFKCTFKAGKVFDDKVKGVYVEE